MKLNFSHTTSLLLKWHLFWHCCCNTRRFSHIKLKQNKTLPRPWPDIRLKLSVFILINRKGWNYLVPMQKSFRSIQSWLKLWVAVVQIKHSHAHTSKGTVQTFPKKEVDVTVLTSLGGQSPMSWNRWPLKLKYSGVKTD